jgi:hypothetical protein
MVSYISVQHLIYVNDWLSTAQAKYAQRPIGYR